LNSGSRILSSLAASFQKESFVGWTRFRHGDFQCTVVTDRPLKMGPPANAFPGVDPKEITELLSRAFLPTDSMTLNQNLLIVNTGEGLVLFDTGCGVNQSFGKSTINGLKPADRSLGFGTDQAVNRAFVVAERTWVLITSLLHQATSFVREFDGTLSVRATFEGFLQHRLSCRR
jgi:hypothetical protein